MKQLQKKRCLEERRLRELRKLAERIAKREKEDPRDVIYDLTGSHSPVKSHEWDEF